MSTEDCLAAIQHNLNIFGGVTLTMGLFGGWLVTHSWWHLWKAKAWSRWWRGDKACPLCGCWAKNVEFVDG